MLVNLAELEKREEFVFQPIKMKKGPRGPSYW